MFKANVIITRRPSILEPEGKAIHQALGNLGYSSVKEVRMGKFAEILIEEDNREDAERVASEAADKLLANPIMEDFTVELEVVEKVAEGK